MIPKNLDEIEYSDLEALLNNQVPEGKTIEYKEIIPSNADKDKVKFLAGVSAFANTNGGDFIIGIKAKDGIPTKLVGLKVANLDAEVLRLEQMLQNSLEPRIPSINIKDDIQSPTGENFIVIRANKSWIAPHKVKINKEFYGRNSKGKYPLDVSELRTAFMLTEQISERIKRFRNERVNKIKGHNELPVTLKEGGKIILHVIPLSAFTSITNINLSKTKDLFDLSLGLGGLYQKINLDGLLSYTKDSKTQASDWYIQLFRNGCIETVYTIEELLYSSFVTPLLQALMDQRKLLNELNIELPLYVFASMVNVKNYKLDSKLFYRTIIEPIDREDLLFPEIVIEEQEQKSEVLLRPVFDMIWNAFGLESCFNYDNEGNYKVRN